jgi:subtilisin family serine protease
MMRIRITAVVLYILSFSLADAQTDRKTWHLQDPGADHYGVSAVDAHCDAATQRVVVAVIDGGTDVDHPDLKENIWINPGEIAGNGIDDDQNGYIDDINGWSFLGGKTGNVDHETLELTRLYRAGKSGMPAGISYKKIKKEYKKERKAAESFAKAFMSIRDSFNVMTTHLGTKNPTASQVESYQMKDKMNSRLKEALVYAMKNGVKYADFIAPIEEGAAEAESQLKYHLNPEYNPRTIVGDDSSNPRERNYGNNDVKGGTPSHGTHVAGIIGAVKNSIGADGVASNVSLMIVRVVPDGDERDKDVANGIRYAADNGAKVINMSFGKDYSPDRAVVEEAIQHAISKDVLIIHGSGNDARDNDVSPNFPSHYLLSSNSSAPNWIEVGASDGDGTAANFSNYGLKNVDVFAPGVNIYSTLPESEYGFRSGTSMAGPVVAGVAALVRSCYPQLNAAQVKEVIMRSVTKKDEPTVLPGDKKKIVLFSSLSVAGGIVDANKALQIAASMMR